MTRRYFYDCPIKAAYMVRYHGMKVHGPVRKPAGGVETSSRPMPVWILARAIEAAEKGMGPEEARYYVAEESVKLLEPQSDDIINYLYPQGPPAVEYVAHTGKLEPHERIIQRNGIAFMWPESESA